MTYGVDLSLKMMMIVTQVGVHSEVKGKGEGVSEREMEGIGCSSPGSYAQEDALFSTFWRGRKEKCYPSPAALAKGCQFV